jgi:hypothetical protein
MKRYTYRVDLIDVETESSVVFFTDEGVGDEEGAGKSVRRVTILSSFREI